MRYLRRRYLALRTESTDCFDEVELMRGVWAMVYRLFGEYGASQTALTKISYDDPEHVLILRCSHKALDMVKAAVAAISYLDDKHIVFRIVAISGTLRALREKVRYDK